MNSERAIDNVLARWVLTRSGSEVLAHATFAASRDEDIGHVCADLAEHGFDASALAQLRSHAWVGDGARFTPFVLDEAANFYLWRNWRHEQRVAQAILARAQARELPLGSAQLAADVAELFAGSEPEATRWQRAAVAAAPGARFFALTGGPGTGKTATVLRILLMLLRHASACRLAQVPRIALAAPTGKAAQRLGEAIAAGKRHLQERLAADSPFRPLLARVDEAQTRTLHRLLGFRPYDSDFEHGPRRPLDADIVVVDEASMIDIALMRQLLDALRPETVLILLGDPGQLHAIEAGSVLGDIASSVRQNALSGDAAVRIRPLLGGDVSESDAPLAGQVITLTHVWRASGELLAALQALRSGDVAGFDIAGGGNAAWRLRECTDAAALRDRLQTWIDNHGCYAELQRADITPEQALHGLREAQILCALRDGTYGARGVNALVKTLLAERAGLRDADDWFHGRPVIITRNDYVRGLYNGDMGVALEDAGKLRVWFAGGAERLRSFSPRTLPAHESAWAITIHRSQGSEYGDVAVVLPPDPDSRILSRELLYTAVSRAGRTAEIWTSATALSAAAERTVQRRGGLRARLTASNPGP
jgi:exodeoxyribonuclease V alpha subunit